MRRHAQASRHLAGGYECHPGGAPDGIVAGADGRLPSGDRGGLRDRTQTGFQRRRPERQIDEAALRNRLATAHAVTNLQRSALAIRAGGIALARGKASLWTHALGRHDDWILCGPDRASLRCSVRLGLRDRLVSMEGLLVDDATSRLLAARFWEAETTEAYIRTLRKYLPRYGPGGAVLGPAQHLPGEPAGPDPVPASRADADEEPTFKLRNGEYGVQGEGRGLWTSGGWPQGRWQCPWTTRRA